jgi:hypothetical protein
MKKRQNPQKTVLPQPITVELPIASGVLPWLLDQYSDEQKRDVTEWKLVGVKSK